jgi:SPP1 family predicted phage head-tail adaptor
MFVGTFRHRVTIQLPNAGASDGMGGDAGASTTVVATVWADITALSARERDIAKGVETERTHVVRIRYRSDVDELCTLLEASSGRSFRVTGVMDTEGRRRELILSCVEIKSDAGAPV